MNAIRSIAQRPENQIRQRHAVRGREVDRVRVVRLDFTGIFQDKLALLGAQKEQFVLEGVHERGFPAARASHHHDVFVRSNSVPQRVSARLRQNSAGNIVRQGEYAAWALPYAERGGSRHRRQVALEARSAEGLCRQNGLEKRPVFSHGDMVGCG